ncbi:hypothetical protein BDV93DRAFT_573428 [Ceratobasidium sp. AG-I]|nr:hypothetical protein BDV93DRAFT_573428 [Ceratobasidium sp. AG-I]
MFEPDINTPTTGDLHHQDPSARAAPLQTMQETKEAEELSTRVTLDGIWLEIFKNPQLKHALWALWIPEALKPLVDAVALGYKRMAGKLPNSHTTVIMILERAGSVLSELPLPESDTHLDQSISCLRQAVLLSPGDDNRMPTRLINLGLALLRRAENRNTVPDISQAIEHLTRAHHLNQTIDRLQKVITWMLGLAYVARFKSLLVLSAI